MNRGLWSIAVFFGTFCVLGCGQTTPEKPPATETGVATTATDAGAGVELTVEADASTITTTDRLRVRITVRRPIGEPVTLVEPDWAGAGWTLVDTVDSEPRLSGEGLIERARTVVLEPFLDGVYPIPSVAVSWQGSGGNGTLASQPLEVRVESVLEADDDGVISPPSPALPPQSPEGDGLPAGVLAAAVLLGAGVVGYLLARPRPVDREPEFDPIHRLRAIADSPVEGESDLCEVHRAVAALEAECDTVALRALLRECERARFGPEDGERRGARDIAADALALLEVRA
ncbi:MAG: hypothetical protein D6692_00690 [Planctomycetota bacterium]|nr:MAG: hypothetical protein D6692_00690 [Planctomycetota bacterium]